MIRFVLIFALVFLLSLGLIASVFAQYGLDMLQARMLPALGISLLVAIYVSFRINSILGRRSRRAEQSRTGAEKGKLGGLLGIGGESASLRARRERIETRRRKLIKAGKLDDDLPVAEPDQPPTRASKTASIDERMAARRERVRRANQKDKS